MLSEVRFHRGPAGFSYVNGAIVRELATESEQGPTQLARRVGLSVGHVQMALARMLRQGLVTKMSLRSNHSAYSLSPRGYQVHQAYELLRQYGAGRPAGRRKTL